MPMNVHPKRFLFSGSFCTFQLNAFSRKLITQRKTLLLTPETSFSFCKELCLSMQEVAITNALSYFLIYKIRVLPPTSNLKTGQDRQPPQTFVIDIFVLILHYPGKPSCVCVRIQGCNMSIFYGTKYWDQ